MTANYKNDLNIARDELLRMFREKEELEVKIAKQQRRVASLSELANENEESDEITDLRITGLPKACWSVLAAAEGKSLTPVEIRDRIVHLRFPVQQYQNIMASIHNALKRMAGAGSIAEENGAYRMLTEAEIMVRAMRKARQGSKK